MIYSGKKSVQSREISSKEGPLKFRIIQSDGTGTEWLAGTAMGVCYQDLFKKCFVRELKLEAEVPWYLQCTEVTLPAIDCTWQDIEWNYFCSTEDSTHGQFWLGSPYHHGPHFLRAMLLSESLSTKTSLFPSFISKVGPSVRSEDSPFLLIQCSLFIFPRHSLKEIVFHI